jgi:TolA-binding protein
VAKVVKKNNALPKSGVKPAAGNRRKIAPAAEEAVHAGSITLEVEAPEVGAASGETRVTLQSSRKFWLYVLGAGLLVLGIVQAYGYYTAWGNPEKVMQRHFDNAQKYTLAKRYDVAIREYQRILDASKSAETTRQAQIGLADLYQETKEYAKAIAIYTRLQKQEPNQTVTAWAELKMAESQLASGDLEGAHGTYVQIMKVFPKSDWDAEARLGTGKVLQAQKRFEEAIPVYQALEKDYHGGFLAADALTQMGLCYEKMSKPGDARKAYQVVVDKYPVMMQDDARKYLKRLDLNQEMPQGVRLWGE